MAFQLDIGLTERQRRAVASWLYHWNGKNPVLASELECKKVVVKNEVLPIFSSYKYWKKKNPADLGDNNPAKNIYLIL